MKTLHLSDINLFDIGQTIQIAGQVWSGNGIAFLTQIPGKQEEDFTNMHLLPLSLEEWVRFNRQADVLETEIISQDTTGITKIILRKSQRQLDNFMQWSIFARDAYTCQYCGRMNTSENPVPLSLDHAPITWEDGGPSIPINLVTACKPCNKNKGRLSFQDWLDSVYYQNVSQHLSQAVRTENEKRLQTLPTIPLVKHIRSR